MITDFQEVLERFKKKTQEIPESGFRVFLISTGRARRKVFNVLIRRPRLRWRTSKR